MKEIPEEAVYPLSWMVFVISWIYAEAIIGYTPMEGFAVAVVCVITFYAILIFIYLCCAIRTINKKRTEDVAQ